MKKLLVYLLPLVLVVLLSGCYTQFQSLSDRYYDDGGYNGYYGDTDAGSAGAYEEGYRDGWIDYSQFAFRDYTYNRFWNDYYSGFYSPYYAGFAPYYNPFVRPFGFVGFGFSYGPYFASAWGYYPYHYAWGYYPYYPYYYSYNYYDVPNSGRNIYPPEHPRSSGVQPVNGTRGNNGSYGYSRPQRGSSGTSRSSGSTGDRATQGTTTTRPERAPRDRGTTNYTPPQRAPRSSGRTAPSPRHSNGGSNSGSRPSRGAQHDRILNNVQGAQTPSQPSGNSPYYRPPRNSGSSQQNATSANYSFHGVISGEQVSSRSSHSDNSGEVGRSHHKTTGSSHSRGYFRPVRHHSTGGGQGYSMPRSAVRAAPPAPHHVMTKSTPTRVERAPRVSHSSGHSTAERPRRH